MNSNKSALTFFQCRSLKGGSNGIIVMLCGGGGNVTTVGVFSLTPRLQVTNVMLRSVT